MRSELVNWLSKVRFPTAFAPIIPTRKYPLEQFEHIALSSDDTLEILLPLLSICELSLELLSRLSPLVAVTVPFDVLNERILKGVLIL
jgi:hypothetical protein